MQTVGSISDRLVKNRCTFCMQAEQKRCRRAVSHIFRPLLWCADTRWM